MLVVLIIVGTCADIASVMNRVAINKDWAVIISTYNKKDPLFLTHLNASLTRISLICKVSAPLFYSLILYFTQVITALIIIAVWNIVSACIEITLLYKLVQLFPDLEYKGLGDSDQLLKDFVSETTGRQDQKSGDKGDMLFTESDSELLGSEVGGEKNSSTHASFSPSQSLFVTEARDDTCSGFREWVYSLFRPYTNYSRQKCFLASLALVFLYMTVLPPGALVINYLNFKNMGSLEIAAFQASCAIVGVFGTFSVTFLMSHLGLGRTGLIMIWLETALLSTVFLQLFVFPEANLWWFLSPIVLSRVPLWSFDVIQVQILQETIAESERGQFSGTEHSLSSFMTFLSFLIGLIAGTPDKFPFLAIASVVCTLIAAILFTFWFLQNDKHETSSDDPTQVQSLQVQ
eukprot:TRINITY_DN6895_c0_g1_i19.p1 TRINITY_DN6895_c0_g1~~TRINITY_DN6895_c0_g1_i19.p1  ORF type:complete len:404 (+),score=63.73 TRINITY_DN6895_c0_g1_i19:304-1515(+)